MCYFAVMGYAGHEERRERILSAAAGLVADGGMERLSVRAVAEAAGIGMGTLRHYFPSQKALHEALILKLVDNETQDFQICDTTVPAATRLEQCVLQFVPTSEEAAQLMDIWFGMYRVGLDPAGAPFARAFLELSTRRSRDRIWKWLEILADEGHLEASSVRMRGLELSALVAGVCLELVTPGSDMTISEARGIVSHAARSIPKESDT